MRKATLLAALALGLTCSSEVRSQSSLGFYGMVTTLRRDHVVEVKVQSLDNWGISTSYWAKVTMGDQVLSLGEALINNLSYDGTAARELVWYVESLEDHGTVKVVFCRPKECTPPIESTFYVD
jgi:hypothetical protein